MKNTFFLSLRKKTFSLLRKTAGFAGVLFMIFALAACSSCSRERRPPINRRSRNHHPEVFKKLSDYSLELIIVTERRTFQPESKNAKITFVLRNTGVAPITIKEWRMKESSNLKLKYAPGTPEEAAKIPYRQWKISKTYEPDDRYADLHNPLILNPQDNNALIEVPLEFVKDVKHIGRRQHFTVIAELNLTSVSAKSRPVEIIVK